MSLSTVYGKRGRVMSVSLRENITAVIESCFSETKEEIQEVAINNILELIRNNTDRPQGEWKPFDLTWGRSIYACSVCEEAIAVPCGWSDGKPIYDYCPMCGAKMKGADDGRNAD